MKGYRTMIVAAVQLLVGILSIAGVAIDEDTAAALANNIEAVVGGVLVITGIVTGVMRAITDSRVGEK